MQHWTKEKEINMHVTPQFMKHNMIFIDTMQRAVFYAVKYSQSRTNQHL
jgi:hypothetical protein